jgi:hypothetical protein
LLRSGLEALADRREEALYSTAELLALERRFVATALAPGDAAGQADKAAVRRALASRRTMGADQRAMVQHIFLGGDCRQNA